MKRTDTSLLTKSPGPMLKHPQTGANYYDGESIISHLNYALGPNGWDWEWVGEGWDEQADEVWVLGRLTARFVVDAMNDEGYELHTASKTVKGWQPVNRRKSDKTPVSLGNDYKGADTDALKRAARLLGVGLDAWEKPGTQQPACDKAYWNKQWHMAVQGTRFEQDDIRHQFINWYSQNTTSSLSDWLEGATTEQAQRLVDTVREWIVKEAEKAKGAA